MCDDVINPINNLLELKDLDIRKSHNSRFIDQKCTPDVISFIADCIINLSLDTDETFRFNDIFKSQYFIKNTQMIFNKPTPTNEKCNNEYDKFITQPLRMLEYSGVLSSNKNGKTYFYKINNKEILNFIALRDKNAYLFLVTYLTKVLKDSGIWSIFENFLRTPTKENFTLLKYKYEKFIIGNTKINGSVETRRIFTKVLNPIAVAHNSLGTKKGNLSKFNILYNDLMYNQVNFRDINKNKNVPRNSVQPNHDNTYEYNTFLLNKAISFVKKLQPYSEVNDKLSGKTTHIHHIFPKSEFPQIADYLENLIALTAGQHLQLAHPNGNTKYIDLLYQCLCLQSKLKTIQLAKTPFYRKENFIFVLNTGFRYTSDRKISDKATYSELESEIAKYYKYT